MLPGVAAFELDEMSLCAKLPVYSERSNFRKVVGSWPT